jgi:endonuclease/exonuclease/phosphatase family metal-dependent hydrolase
MSLKIIQLNVWNFKFAEQIIEFLKAEKPDIVNLQEIATGVMNSGEDKRANYFETLKHELGMQGIFAPRLTIKSKDGSTSYWANGFLTNLEIVDSGYFYDRHLPETCEMTEDHPFLTSGSKEEKWTMAFEFPANYVWGLLKYHDHYIRNLTTHFTVSYNCSETLQMINHARAINNFLDRTKPYPTIFTGDCNLSENFYSIKLIEQKLQMVNKASQNSLCPSLHPVFKNDLPQGLKVDYIFQKGFEVIATSTPVIAISDHLPVIAELELL